MTPVIRFFAIAGTMVVGLAALAATALRGAEPYHAATGPAGSLAVDDRVAVAVLDGDAAARGRQLGAWCAPQIRSLLALMPAGDGAAALAGFPADLRAELEALAAAAGVDAGRLAAANLAMEPGCSVAVAMPLGHRPLRIARNMDFAPADALGRGTLVTIARGGGTRAVASVGWPGFVGIVSGMNDAGVTACVLVNLSDSARRPGEPICVRLRRVLERAATLDEAVAAFQDGPLSSSHFALLADARGAVIAWQDAAGFHRDHPVDGWLLATNGARDPRGIPLDARGAWLARTTAGALPSADEAWLRQLLGGCCLRGLNAQAMLFEPATLRLQLATGGARSPAATSAWHALDLAPLLRHGRLPEPLSSPVGP